MKKVFEAPELEVAKFSVEDVITTSGEGTGNEEGPDVGVGGLPIL